MNVELMFCQETILNEIKHKECKRNDLSLTYAFIISSSERDKVNWSIINKAIIDRWSLSGLYYIKNRAWKLLKNKHDTKFKGI